MSLLQDELGEILAQRKTVGSALRKSHLGLQATFVIDPEGVLRAMLYYPMSAGRSVKEILRLVRALRTGDEHGVATPAGWEPGEQVVVPPPRTVPDAARRTDNRDYDCRDWYFCKKDL